MANVIKVRCNGPGKHVNEVDIDRLATPTAVLRSKQKYLWCAFVGLGIGLLLAMVVIAVAPDLTAAGQAGSQAATISPP